MGGEGQNALNFSVVTPAFHALASVATLLPSSWLSFASVVLDNQSVAEPQFSALQGRALNEVKRAPATTLDPPLPENSDDTALHSAQTHSEFLGRGGWGGEGQNALNFSVVQPRLPRFGKRSYIVACCERCPLRPALPPSPGPSLNYANPTT